MMAPTMAQSLVFCIFVNGYDLLITNNHDDENYDDDDIIKKSKIYQLCILFCHHQRHQQDTRMKLSLVEQEAHSLIASTIAITQRLLH